VDFWAQHKDFVLKVLAGFGVFLVALIARGITYGDDLENAQARNRRLASQVKGMKIAPVGQIRAMENAADALQANARTIVGQIGWNAAQEGLHTELLRRILGALRTTGEGGDLDREVDLARQAIRDDLNGGFGQLRLRVRDDLVEEGGEKGIDIVPGIGFAEVLEVKGGELTKYLLQLEATARVVRLCIDHRVDAVREIRLAAPREDEALPGANPEFLREYFVDVVFRSSQEAATAILNGLDRGKRIPWRDVRFDRLKRPADHVEVSLRVATLVANPDVPFEVEQNEESPR